MSSGSVFPKWLENCIQALDRPDSACRGAPDRRSCARAEHMPEQYSPAGQGESLAIDKECRVGNGTYKYADINIIAGGSLIFDEVNNSVIDFWARSIIIENEGKLIAGSTNAPFGSKDGQLTIHLWGSDQGVRGPGAVCKSPLNNNSPCGIPRTSGRAMAQRRFAWPAVRTIFINTRLCPSIPLATLATRCSPFPTAARYSFSGGKGQLTPATPTPKIRVGAGPGSRAQSYRGQRAWRSPVRSTGVRTTVSSSRPPTTYQTIQRNW